MPPEDRSNGECLHKLKVIVRLATVSTQNKVLYEPSRVPSERVAKSQIHHSGQWNHAQPWGRTLQLSIEIKSNI
jgi:hypothetical protein